MSALYTFGEKCGIHENHIRLTYAYQRKKKLGHFVQEQKEVSPVTIVKFEQQPTKCTSTIGRSSQIERKYESMYLQVQIYFHDNMLSMGCIIFQLL